SGWVADPEAFLAQARHLRSHPEGSTRNTLELKDGRVLDSHTARLRGVAGEDFGWAWYLRDVTAERQAQLTLVHANANLAALAGTLQESLLPPELPWIQGLELAARFRPFGAGIEVGGDFYDAYETARNDWAVVIGDVCGKGPEAARVTALARYTLRAAAISARRPRVVLGVLNDALLRQQPDGRFCTVAYLRLRPGAGGVRAVVASGGHPLPLRVGHDGRVASLGHAGPLLGVLPTVSLRDHTVTLRPGEILVLYTDGVTEARGEDGEFGEERLREVLAGCSGLHPSEVADAVDEAVSNHMGGRPRRDDMALLVLRVR
ncbi:MAG: PP2C family protein-serine/threonine phosphatase, partial [Acidimicrobiales bacterium]